jgi:predicted HicB family RNase H-like nuclease
MSSMTYRGYSARVEYDPDDEIFFGRLAGTRAIVGFHADTVAGLKAAFREAVDDYLALCAERGVAPEKSYSGNLMLRVDPAVHAKAAQAAELAGKSLNQWGEEVLAAAAKRQAG